VETLHNRGVTRRRLGQLEEAVADFSRALQLDSDLRLAYRNRALALASLGRATEARADARRFLELGGIMDEELEAVMKGER
jgi:Flp pilus assembly protein TadD